jgi:PAS domain S-box-containing protein
LKTRTGFDAVGIRLQDGEDFPYFAQKGFLKDFLMTENSIVERCKEGGICHDKDGNVNLECTCGLVISGKADQSHPLFTRGGSFWTNDSFPLLDLPSDQDPRFHPRNQCIHQGYASVALVPIRNKGKIVGLIHLNDRRKGCLSLNTVELLEGIASHIGAAMIRKQAEEEVQIQRQNLANIIEGTHVGTWEWNVQTGETLFNERWAEIVGYTLADIAPISFETWLNLAHPDDVKTSKIILQKHFSGELDYYDNECRMKHKNGSWVWVHDRGKVVEWTPDGRPLRMSGTHDDISDRKQVEYAIQESKSNFHSFVESMTDMIMVGTQDGRLLFTNTAVTQTLGYSAEELAAMHILDLHSADQRREAEKIFTAMFNDEQKSCPMPLVTKSGVLIPVETRVWFGQWNGEKCIFGISKNLTAEQDAQQRFERLFRCNPALMALSTPARSAVLRC